jgi:mono/diheme cytochrome c family protein
MFLAIRSLVVLTSIALLPVSAAASTALEPAHDLQAGREVYERACANCHGPDGRGGSRTELAFEDPLPDFTDCSFTTREPDADWLAIVHEGGPARAFGRMMPAFGSALSMDEMRASLAYIRSLCGDAAWPRGELNLPRALLTEKAFPEDEMVITSAANAEGDGAVTSKFIYERRIGPRNQIELVVPFSAHQISSGGAWGSGVGDVVIGGKRALYHDVAKGSIFSAAAEIILPTGSRSRGFGKGTAVFEPFVSCGQILPANTFLQFQSGVELPFDTDRAAREAFWRMAAGRSFAQQQWGRTWSPMVELVAARELVSGERVQWDVVPQLQVTLSTRQHIMANVGVRLPINERDRSTQVLFYLLWDWFDGPLFGGW